MYIHDGAAEVDTFQPSGTPITNGASPQLDKHLTEQQLGERLEIPDRVSNGIIPIELPMGFLPLSI